MNYSEQVLGWMAHNRLSMPFFKQEASLRNCDLTCKNAAVWRDGEEHTKLRGSKQKAEEEALFLKTPNVGGKT